jgi:hypothetical protein
VTLQCPSTTLSPTLGTKFGRRERESRREGRREQSLREKDSFACRDGERHPGLREAGALRGAPVERRPWSVRKRAGVPPKPASAPMTAGCLKAAEEGNDVGIRHKAYAPVAGTRDRCMRTVTRPSLGPSTRARRSSLHTAGAIPGGGALEVASRLGKPTQVGGTSTGAITNGRSAARHVSEVSQGIAPGTEEKDGGRGLPPCEDRKSSGLVARTSNRSCRSR